MCSKTWWETPDCRDWAIGYNRDLCSKNWKGAFTIPVQLSDNDVDTVIHKVFLANPASLPALDKLYKDNIGSSHVSDSTASSCKDDDQYFLRLSHPSGPPNFGRKRCGYWTKPERTVKCATN